MSQGIHGAFRIYPGDPKRELVIPNTLVSEGELSFLKMICQADESVLAGGANFYMGLCGNTFDADTTLANLAGEPTAGVGGYARQAIARSSGGWPNAVRVNNTWRLSTNVVNFSAAGADFSISFRRIFLCNASVGIVGTLFAVSGALPTDQLVIDGQTFPAQYELYLK